jgi:hypothetical protein
MGRRALLWLSGVGVMRAPCRVAVFPLNGGTVVRTARVQDRDPARDRDGDGDGGRRVVGARTARGSGGSC